MHAYWRGIQPPDAPLPGRQHFDPAEIPQLLPTIRLYEVHRAPWRFRYRLVGTEIARIIGRELTGTWMNDRLADFEQSSVGRTLIFIAEGRGFSYYRGQPIFQVTNKDHLSSEGVLLPLARNGRDVDMILALSVYHAVNGAVIRRRTAVAV